MSCLTLNLRAALLEIELLYAFFKKEGLLMSDLYLEQEQKMVLSWVLLHALGWFFCVSVWLFVPWNTNLEYLLTFVVVYLVIWFVISFCQGVTVQKYLKWTAVQLVHWCIANSLAWMSFWLLLSVFRLQYIIVILVILIAVLGFVVGLVQYALLRKYFNASGRIYIWLWLVLCSFTPILSFSSILLSNLLTGVGFALPGMIYGTITILFLLRVLKRWRIQQ